MPYVNPIPAIGAGKEFELRLVLKYDNLMQVDDAKRDAARFLLEQDEATVASWMECLRVKALYPSDLTSEERARLECTGKEDET